jgi:hypothetical protein
LIYPTDMAVIVSQSQNEIDDLKQKSLDILPHRTRMQKEDLESKFKDDRRGFFRVASAAARAYKALLSSTSSPSPSRRTIISTRPKLTEMRNSARDGEHQPAGKQLQPRRFLLGQATRIQCLRDGPQRVGTSSLNLADIRNPVPILLSSLPYSRSNNR